MQRFATRSAPKSRGDSRPSRRKRVFDGYDTKVVFGEKVPNLGSGTVFPGFVPSLIIPFFRADQGLFALSEDRDPHPAFGYLPSGEKDGLCDLPHDPSRDRVTQEKRAASSFSIRSSRRTTGRRRSCSVVARRSCPRTFNKGKAPTPVGPLGDGRGPGANRGRFYARNPSITGRTCGNINPCLPCRHAPAGSSAPSRSCFPRRLDL